MVLQYFSWRVIATAVARGPACALVCVDPGLHRQLLTHAALGVYAQYRRASSCLID
jgi:hypothetical protein